MSSEPAKPDAAALCVVAHQVLKHIEIIVQHAALEKHDAVCAFSLECIFALTIKLTDMETKDAFFALAGVSRGPATGCQIEGQSATEWAIRLGQFLCGTVLWEVFMRNGRNGLLKIWKDLRYSFIPRDKPDEGKRYLSTFSHHAHDRPVQIIWRAPEHPHEIRERAMEVRWESAQIQKATPKKEPMKPQSESPPESPDESHRRFMDRDEEVARLKEENRTRTGGQIANLIRKNPAWAKMENGKDFDARAARSILARARKSGRLS